MKVDDLQIDDRLKSVLIQDGIEKLYPPQTEAVQKGLLTGKNFVVAIPTASGKTLIAILSMISTLLNSGGKAIYLAPLRALASEKYEEFSRYADAVDLRVSISTGDMDNKAPWLGSSDIIIATNEKFDSLIRHKVTWLNDIKVIVSDEIHLINDADRGPVLEVVLSLIRRNIKHCQIVALSATIINADELAEWLDAELILSDWRPVKLKEGVWHNGSIKYADGSIVTAGEKSDTTGYISLSTEIVVQGGQALVFANTRKSAMSTSKNISKKLHKILSKQNLDELQEIANTIRSKGEKTELRERLAKTVEKGSAFHHAGLIAAHRKIIEDAFRQRIIKVISSTPSLAAGVNLPSRRVIIRSLSRFSMGFGNYQIPVLEYKQMAGRAGRPNFDPYGEAIVVARNYTEIQEILDRYIRADTEEIYSKLGTEPALRSHILAFIYAGYVTSFDTAITMISATFYGYQNEGSLYIVENEILKVFDILVEAKLITTKEPYRTTPFGKRTTELYLDPLSARLLKKGLEKTSNNKSIPEIAYLQLIASTPDVRSYNLRQKDYNILFDIAEKYTDDWIDIEFDDFSEFDQDLFFTTLKTAFAVQLWLNESSEEHIFKELAMTSGDLHYVRESCEWMLHCAAEFSKIFKWKNHRKSLLTMINRLKYGIKKELLPLVEIPNIGRVRARSLYNAGYKSIESIINAKEEEIARLPRFGPLIARNLVKALTDGTEFKILDGDASEEPGSGIQESLTSYFD